MPISVKTFIPGIKVVRGKDWNWDDQDGGEGSVGEMIEKSVNEGWVKVKWGKNNYPHSYQIGADDQYDLYFADDRDALLQEAMERFPSGCSYKDMYKNLRENIEYTYPGCADIDKTLIFLEIGEGLVYKKGTWATRTDVEQKIYKPLPIGGYFTLPTEAHKKHVTTWLDSIGWQRVRTDALIHNYLFISHEKYHTGVDTPIRALPFETLYEYGMPQFDPVKETKVEVFPGIYGGDVVVSLNVNDMKAPLTPDELLIEEAKKRYPVGTKFYPVHTPVDPKQYCIITKDSEFIISDYGSIYSAINGAYWMHQSNKKYGTTILNRKVYCNKKLGWAQIVEEKKQELSPLEICKQMYSAGDLVEAFDHKGRKLSRMLLTESGLQQLQAYKNNGNSISYPGLAGYLYCSHNNKYARIIDKRPNFINQTNTNQNGNETKEVEQSINSTISKSITREHNENTDSNNRQHSGKPIEVRRVSASITVGDQRRTTPVSGRECKTKLTIGHLSN